MAERRPHILLTVADDLSARDLGVYGIKRAAQPTPHLDELVTRGALFQNAWMTPACRPSRAALMTGWYGPKTGYLSNKNRPVPGTIASIGTIGHALRALGYRTAVAGKWQHDPTPAQCGFDEHFIWRRWDGYTGPVEGRGAPKPGRPSRYWHPALVENDVGVPTGPDDYGPDLIARWVVDFIARDPDTPAFVLHNAVLVHTAWHFGLGQEGYIPTPGEDRTGFGSLNSNIAQLDELVGRTARQLEGPRTTPLLMVTSDNGTRGWGKYVLRLQRGPRVMLIVAGNGVAPGGRRNQLVDSSDFYPTLCHLGGSLSTVRDGQSFVPALVDPDHVGREWIYSWLDDHDFVRTHGWLLDGKGDLYQRRPGGRSHRKAADTPEAADARKSLEKIARTIRSKALVSG